MSIRKIKSFQATVIIPRTDEDLKELKRLDDEGKLASGNSYPKFEKKETVEANLENAERNLDAVEAALDRIAGRGPDNKKDAVE